MPYHLSTADIAPPIRLGQSAWQRTQLPVELGCCFTDAITLDDGLHLAYASYTPTRDLCEISHLQRERTALTLTVALQGESATIATDGQRFDFAAGYSTLAAFASIRGERHFSVQHPIRQLRLIVGEPLLHKYGLENLIHDTRHDHCARHLSCGKHAAATQRLAETLVHLHDQRQPQMGSLLDLQIAALGLLSEQTRHLQPPVRPATTTLSAQDQDKILRARDILTQHFDRTLTVTYLCAAVGTNEFKLKQGFRQLFGTSVHRMLTDIRMQKAMELLETGLAVSTVAYKVGYQHPSSFSTAFAQYYGRAPKSIVGG